jgi:hypothetical protein
LAPVLTFDRAALGPLAICSHPGALVARFHSHLLIRIWQHQFAPFSCCAQLLARG